MELLERAKLVLNGAKDLKLKNEELTAKVDVLTTLKVEYDRAVKERDELKEERDKIKREFEGYVSDLEKELTSKPEREVVVE